ncbi:MAG: ABC transporter permease, partial [Planctomycetota bacterium]
MFRYALNNLFAKKVRTLLCLILLTMVLAGTIGLISLSSGMRSTVSNSLKKIEGIAVIAEGSADPIFSSIPLALVERVQALDGVSVAVPEIWGIVARLDEESPLTKGWFSAAAFGGVDPERAEKLREGGLYGSAVEGGRFIRPGDKRVIIISRKIAQEYDKKLEDKAKINGVTFEVVGIYHTGSMFLDQAILMPLEDARKLKGMGESVISAIYVEPEDTSKEALTRIASEIRALSPGIE